MTDYLPRPGEPGYAALMATRERYRKEHEAMVKKRDEEAAARQSDALPQDPELVIDRPLIDAKGRECGRFQTAALLVGFMDPAIREVGGQLRADACGFAKKVGPQAVAGYALVTRANLGAYEKVKGDARARGLVPWEAPIETVLPLLLSYMPEQALRVELLANGWLDETALVDAAAMLGRAIDRIRKIWADQELRKVAQNAPEEDDDE